MTQIWGFRVFLGGCDRGGIESESIPVRSPCGTVPGGNNCVSFELRSVRARSGELHHDGKGRISGVSFRCQGPLY